MASDLGIHTTARAGISHGIYPGFTVHYQYLGYRATRMISAKQPTVSFLHSRVQRVSQNTFQPAEILVAGAGSMAPTSTRFSARLERVQGNVPPVIVAWQLPPRSVHHHRPRRRGRGRIPAEDKADSQIPKYAENVYRNALPSRRLARGGSIIALVLCTTVEDIGHTRFLSQEVT